MGSRFLPVAAGAGDLRFQQSDARIQFIQRISIQAFAVEEARSAKVRFGLARLRSIIVVHLR